MIGIKTERKIGKTIILSTTFTKNVPKMIIAITIQAVITQTIIIPIIPVAAFGVGYLLFL